VIYDGVNHLGKIILILSARKCTVALVGGGTYPTPEEISFAHNGVLLLNELLEFNRSVLEVMRQHHIMEAIAAAATSTAPTTSTCNTSSKRLNYRGRWLGGAGGDGEAIVIEASIFCYFNFRIKEK